MPASVHLPETVWAYRYESVSVYLCVHVYIHVYIHVCTHVCTCVLNHTHTLPLALHKNRHRLSTLLRVSHFMACLANASLWSVSEAAW